MNIKNITLSIIFGIISLSMHAMETTPEQDLIDKRISQSAFLEKIEKGLYGPTLALYLKLIKEVDYGRRHTGVENLYQSILHDLGVILRSNQYDDKYIRRFMASKIVEKYNKLKRYLANGVVQLPTTSGSGD